MGLFKVLFGGPSQQKGESYSDFASRRHEQYKDSWVDEKKRSGEWLPKAEYEKKAGRPGRK